MARSHVSRFVISLVACAGLAAADHARAQSQLDMNITADQAARDAQAQLDKTIQTYRRRLTSNQKRLFDLSQHRWEKYRRAACEFQSSGAAGGSIQPMVVSYCWRDYTIDRLRVLKYLLTCAEGDSSCPVVNHGT